MLTEYVAQHPPQDPQVALAWEYILSALNDEYITEEMAIQSIEGLTGSEKAWDEFGIVTSENDPDTVEVYYGGYSHKAYCNKHAFLAYYKDARDNNSPRAFAKLYRK